MCLHTSPQGGSVVPRGEVGGVCPVNEPGASGQENGVVLEGMFCNVSEAHPVAFACTDMLRLRFRGERLPAQSSKQWLR